MSETRTTYELVACFKRIEREVKHLQQAKQLQEDMSLKFELESIARNLDVLVAQLQKKAGKP